VPLGVVTVTSTVPLAWGGSVAEITVSESTVNALAELAPKETALAPVKPLPLMLTTVPPPVLPVVGLRAVTAGAAAAE
jgi:hypothetical protein